MCSTQYPLLGSRASACICLQKIVNTLMNAGTCNQILHCMQRNQFQPVCGDSCPRHGTKERQIINCIQSSHLNFSVWNGNTYGHALCMGCQDELFQIGRKRCHRSLGQHTTQNFLPRLDKGKGQKQIRRLLDNGTGIVATAVS